MTINSLNLSTAMHNCFHHPPTAEKFYYGLRIVTGSQTYAGTTDIAVYVRLTGAKYTTTIPIGTEDGFSTIFKTYFGTGTFDDVLIECDAEIETDVFTVGLKVPFGTIFNYWYVDFMQVYDFQKVNKIETFPCYHWIGSPNNEISCTAQTSKPSFIFIATNYASCNNFYAFSHKE